MTPIPTPTIERCATTAPSSQSVLTSLRLLIPRCQLDYDDTKLVAERQAARLRQALGGRPTETAIAGLPRVQIVHEQLPTSGLSYWNGQCWIIALNDADRPARQRFTLLHELKHIIDHGAAKRLYRNQWQAERAADYFAACALIPKPELKRLFCNVTQDPGQLATYFGVSPAAIRVRLTETRLIEPTMFTRTMRCARPVSTPTWEEQRFAIVQPNCEQRRYA